MSEILDALAALPPAAADLLVVTAVLFGVGALGLAWSLRPGPDDRLPDEPTPRREDRRKHRDRPQP